jgi:hypothetical protein
VKEVDRLGWAVTVPLQAGEYVLGVRVGSSEMAVLLRQLFAERVVPAAAPPGNLSLFVAPVSDQAAQELHRLYVTFTRTVRTRSVGRLLDGLWHELDGRDAREMSDVPLLEATVLVSQGRAHLLPANSRAAIVDDERRWARSGLQLVDRRWLEIDAAEGTVTIPPSGLPAGKVQIPSIDGVSVSDREEPAQPVGTFPIGSWTLSSSPQSLAKQVVFVAGSVLDRQRHDGERLLHQLADLLHRLPKLEPGWTGKDELRELLSEFSGSGSD